MISEDHLDLGSEKKVLLERMTWPCLHVYLHIWSNYSDLMRPHPQKGS